MKTIGNTLLAIVVLAMIACILISVPSGRGRKEPHITRMNCSEIVSACYNYRHAYGHWPKFRHASDLSQILFGENDRKLKFLSPTKQLTNKQNEFIDGWKRQLIIRDVDNEIIHFHSSGADGVFDTKDDIIETLKKGA